MEPHGGYLFRKTEVDAGRLVPLARQALLQDGERNDDCSLLFSVIPALHVVRIAFDAPFTYGRRGARWYQSHHAFARLLSVELGVTVHSYVFDPAELEQVASYGGGAQVGGDRLLYDEVELDDDELEDERAYERVKEKWPLGHLAKVLGVRRKDLLHLPRTYSLLVHLDGSQPEMSVAELLARRAG